MVHMIVRRCGCSGVIAMKHLHQRGMEEHLFIYTMQSVQRLSNGLVIQFGSRKYGKALLIRLLIDYRQMVLKIHLIKAKNGNSKFIGGIQK